MTEDQAKSRFMILNFVRLTAVLFVLAGVANLAGKLMPDLAPGLGLVLLLVGMTDFFLAPMVLKKHWQKQDG